MEASSTAPSLARPSSVRLRALCAQDRAAIERIVRATGAFRDDEVAVALELIDEGLGIQVEDPYEFLVAVDEDERVLGYACYGHKPHTAADWDLYWIAVDPALHGRGVGKRLLAASEEAARAAGGARMLAHTEAKASYAATRAFYEGSGYGVIARDADHYGPGEDMLVYARGL